MSIEEDKEDLFLLDLKKRSLISNYANITNLEKLDKKYKTVYWGVDATGESLHIGHVLQIIQCFRFLKKGFRVYILLGGATSLIGDPSDKKKERKKEDLETINFYQKKIKKEIKRMVFFDGTYPTSFSPLELFFGSNSELVKKIYEILGIEIDCSTEKKWIIFLSYIFPFSFVDNCRFINNSLWLKKINCVDFINVVGRNISINYLLSKEWVKKREKTGVSYSTFSYSLLQSYDFLKLYEDYDCCGQIGGSDQWGTMTTGLKLINSCSSKDDEKKKPFVISFSLIIDSEGRKISKSEKKCLFLNSKKTVFYDFFRNLSDDTALDYIKKLTFLSFEQIDELLKLNIPPKLRILQRILLELVWFLNYKEIDSLKKVISI